ncbi:MAG: hypothetical protein HRU12_07350 [Phaeodactylibacter sp.]|nr:hypothetical protein [Phaeodactylibacter sp.]
MHKDLKRSELIKNRLLQCCEKGELFTYDLVEILNRLGKDLNLCSNSEAARLRGITPQGMKKRVDDKKEMVVELNGIKLISVI